ncbi:ABC transporter permease [Bacillus andreraoultii]|uniref:ABC transporter permease n=1 Tax=Bacillus andreraoultii TaxID=1499685 RepID=UPI00053B14E9|nr:ABC transporter permease [Bacillus andreraoultii]
MTLSAVLDASEMGVIFAIMALGVYISFRILNFADLTVDGSFVTGGAVAAVMIVNGVSPILASLAALVAGFLAGCLTGILHTKGKINDLLSGILMMLALYSINLRIMGLTLDSGVSRPNIPLLNSETIFTQVQAFFTRFGLTEYGVLISMVILTFIFKFVTDYFLKTEIGLSLRATGDNKRMIRSFSANTDGVIILGLGISNGFVAFSGALIAQYNQFSDVGMGIGMIVVGLASIIIGEAIFGKKTIARTTLAVVFGAIIYRIFITLALNQGILDASDQKFVTAIIVILALVFPKMLEKRREKKRKAKHQLSAKLNGKAREEGESIA